MQYKNFILHHNLKLNDFRQQRVVFIILAPQLKIDKKKKLGGVTEKNNLWWMYTMYGILVKNSNNLMRH